MKEVRGAVDGIDEGDALGVCGVIEVQMWSLCTSQKNDCKNSIASLVNLKHQQAFT